MSGEGDGDCGQQKQEDDLQSPVQETNGAQSSQRPATAVRRRTPNSRSGTGEGSSYTRNLSEQEKRVGGQARMLLERFILDMAESDNLGPTQKSQVQDAVCPDVQQGKSQSPQPDEDYLEDVGAALRDIGDLLNQDYDLNSLIDKVPIQSPKEIFMKVCKQMFSDGQFNWGRVVALFYFAYRLIAKAISAAATDTIPWIKNIFSWALDFFLDYVLWWIIQRGGWRMIREYWGSSRKTLTGLGLAAICTVFYVWWKQQ